MVEKLSLPSMAEWRWHQLPDGMEILQTCLSTIRDNLDFSWFEGLKDRTGIEKIRKAFASDDWFAQWDFVFWFSSIWLGPLMRWIGTCVHNCAPGVRCFFRGRLLPWAYDQAKRVLDCGLEVCNEWGINRFVYVYIWQQGQAAVRAVHLAGMNGIAYLDELPWRLARLRQPGIAGRCMADWLLTAPQYHHPWSHWFLNPAFVDGLADDVAEMFEDGTNISPRLDAAITKIENCPMDDITGEQPHARAKKIVDHATAGSFAWCASTSRLNPNLDNCESFAQAFDRDLQTEWDRWSSVIKVKDTDRPCRATPKQVYFPSS